MSRIGFEDHNHGKCVRTALRAAELQCRAQGLRLTPVRRRVLEILLEEHRALGAYDILAYLSREGLGTQPPVAYRALDFLVGHGFAHKVEKKNAFIACSFPGEAHTPAFMICRACDGVIETRPMATANALAHSAKDLGFQIENTVLEAEGLCPVCDAAEQRG